VRFICDFTFKSTLQLNIYLDERMEMKVTLLTFTIF